MVTVNRPEKLEVKGIRKETGTQAKMKESLVRKRDTILTEVCVN